LRYAITMMGKIRIISGQWRGRKLPVADSPGLRPTGDRARETLFNWLGQRTIGARCVDLFAGTGALGLEAASRGAGAVDLVEKDRQLVRLIEDHTRAWPGIDKVRFIAADVLHWMATQPGGYDLIFIDPPFDQSLHQSVLDALVEHGMLNPEALIYVECDAAEDPVAQASHSFRITREKRQGGVMLRLLKV